MLPSPTIDEVEDAEDFVQYASVHSLKGSYAELDDYALHYDRYKTLQVSFSFKPSEHLNFLNIADSMVKVYLDAKDNEVHQELDYANLTKPTIYTKTMRPWTIVLNCSKDPEGRPRTYTGINSIETLTGTLYLKSDGLAMLDVATLTGANGPVIKIGEQSSPSLFLRIGTLSVKSSIKVTGLRHTNDDDY